VRLRAIGVLLAFGLAVLASRASAAAADPPVDYRLSPVIERGTLVALRVEIHFHEGPSGHTRLAWADDWAGDSELWSHARDMKIEGGEATPDGPGAWIVKAAPGTPITATYRIVSAYDHDPTDDDSRQSRPVVRPTWFYSVGEALFALPRDQEKAPATFEWTGAPRGFGFASDLQHLAGARRPALRAGTVQDVLESIAIGGWDLKLAERREGKATLRVATVGKYGFDPADFAELAFKVLETERSFWREDAQPFLVTMTPTVAGPGRISYGGSGFGDSFALWVDDNTKLADLRWLLAHEYFHTWNPAALGGIADGSQEPATYWFSEGFTDYYAWKLMLASGQFAPAEFAARWNETLRAYAASPVRSAPNSLIVSDFWKSQAVEKLPYQRGALLAAILDREAKLRGSSLDAVMHEMRRRASPAGKGQPADVLFPTVYREVIGFDPAPLIARHMIAGEPLALPADTFGPCFAVRTIQGAAFERGWDREATSKAGQVITGLKDDSAAYAAGLRNGMKLVEFVSGEPGESRVAYVLRVKPPEGPEQTIRFFPAGKTSLSMQEVEAVKPGAEPARCG
jgi:predicted metalloprotease with PDZ domain